MQEDDGKHQDQVKELTEKTADSLDDLALKMLFVSVQQNNLELCISYAVKHIGSLLDTDTSTFQRMVRIIVVPDRNCCAELTLLKDFLVQHCLMWFPHSYVS